VAFSTKIYCKFTAEYAVKNLRPVNIWLSYRQESRLSHALCVPGHCPAETGKMKKSPDILSMAVVNCFYVDFNLA